MSSLQNEPVFVSLEFTPNPNTLKYSVNRTLLPKGAVNFTQIKDAQERSPLAYKLMSVDGIRGVMIGTDFITVTKSEEGDWDHVHKSCSTLLEAHLMAQEPILLQPLNPMSAQEGTELEEKIKKFLDEEVRPAVAMDGGDIMFDRYEAGVVYLHMQGSCAGCPSSTMTLKQGIEVRLREMIPEVLEVVAV